MDLGPVVREIEFVPKKQPAPQQVPQEPNPQKEPVKPLEPVAP